MDHRSLRSARVPRRAAALALTAALSVGALVSSHAASAEEEIIVDVQPPAPRVEVIPVAPSAHHFWIHGYYGWVGGRHVWVPGRYEVMRPGWSWSEARWGLVGRRWHFYPGHWYR
jgi:hypothetical protein